MSYSQSPLDFDPANKEKLEIISRLAGGIAHDYNNLLAVVLLHADMLASSDDESVRRRAKEIKMAAQRASALTRQLLAFSGRQVMSLRPVDLSEELDRLHPTLVRILGPNITLETKQDHGATYINSDPIYLEQVMINLVKNAHDAMPSGGRVTISTGYESEPEPRVVLAVSDAGVGMEADVLSRVFEPFFTTSKGKKTGLGLSTAFGLVKQMDGEIQIESEMGKGTIVRIYLQPVQMASNSVVEAHKHLLRGNETILLVDDESMVRSASCEMLELFGYQVIEAGDGFEALEICEEADEPIALALVDIEMDRMDGPTLAKKIRERWPKIKILFMSGLSEDVVQEEGILAKGDQFISKPYDPDELAERIRVIIQG
jgi:two-component system, cell cycle sensor histidine kinase and response regulator CckA